MSSLWDLEKITGAFSDAAVGAISWPDALGTISQAVDGFGATLLPVEGRLPPRLPTSASFQEAIDIYLKDEWSKRDIRFRGAPKILATGVATDLDFTTVEEMRHSPYYQDWLARFGLRWFAGIKIDGFEERWVLSLQRSDTQLPFDQEEQARLVSLSRSFAASAVLARMLGFASANAAMGAFDISDKAAALLNRHAKVVQHNAAAEGIFGDDIYIRNGKLKCRDLTSERALESTIRNALDWPVHVERPVVIRRADGPPVIVHVVAAKGLARDVLASAQLVVVFTDLSSSKVPSDIALQEIFALSAAESRVARRLASGMTTRQISTDLGIAYETVRQHVKSIFYKTATRSQSSLVSVLQRLSVRV